MTNPTPPDDALVEKVAQELYHQKEFSPLLIGVGRRPWERATPEQKKKAITLARAIIPLVRDAERDDVVALLELERRSRYTCARECVSTADRTLYERDAAVLTGAQDRIAANAHREKRT